MKEKYSVMSYRYRDASNYKAHGEVLISGIFDEGDISLLRTLLYDNEYFVPEQVGIPPLQHILYEFGGMNDDDHEWHELVEIRRALAEDMRLPLVGSKPELISRFRSVK